MVPAPMGPPVDRARFTGAQAGSRVVVAGLGLAFGFDAGGVVRHLARDLLVGPAERAGHEPRRGLGGAQAAVPGLDRRARAPGEDVLQVRRALVRGGVDDLDLEVVVGPGQRLAERRVVGDQRQQVVEQRAVAVQQVLDARHVHARGLRDPVARAVFSLG